MLYCWGVSPGIGFSSGENLVRVQMVIRKQSCDGRVLEVMLRSTKQPRPTPIRRAHETRGTATVSHNRNFHLHHSSNLEWKVSELWQTLLNSGQERPFSLLFTWDVFQRVHSELILIFIYWVASIFAFLAVRSVLSDFAMQIRLHGKDHIGLANNCTLLKFNVCKKTSKQTKKAAENAYFE